jgi:hypothetical protein
MPSLATTTSISDDHVAGGRVDRWRVGPFAHTLIAQLLAAGERQPGAERIARAANQLRLLGEVGAYRVAVKQRVVSAVALYFRLFLPTVEWTFNDSDVSSRSERFYLVWRSAAGTLVDELKAGPVGTQLERKALCEEARREATAGRSKFGQEFLGLRVVILGAPRWSFLAGVDGREVAIEWEGSDER